MEARYQDGFDDRATDGLVCSLQKPTEVPYLTGAGRTVLAYADEFMTNHLSIDDGTLDRVCAITWKEGNGDDQRPPSR
ncbi:hypothetical protein U5A82_03790 [Sphingobium sp. CR2-8]|uniref:hypothetical protein n=1 Tax=Sphingobium sp. CR2-8 TaxID=1306534 RepID=UPI002DBC9568|nr:hypothetical protein [Sphingobium sp. CR2-8]MEC3909623.1 hypothetical protein [Sphingobium sp. CR2-8]